MLKNILKLTKDLIRIPSTSDNKPKLFEVLERALEEVPGFTLERFESNGIPSLLIHNQPKRPEKFRLILNGHLDVVPGRQEQYKMEEKDGRLYGRGTDDMKAATSVLILLFREMADKVKYPLALQLVTDEETGGFDGVKHQIAQGVVADFFITGETTNLNIKNEAKGVIWATLTAHGKTAHGAYPWRGENAVWKLKPFMDKLQEVFPVPPHEAWQTTVNLANFNTDNKTHNKVPDQAVLGIDVRYIPSEAKTVLDKIKAMVPSGVDFELLENDPFHHTDPNYPMLLKLKETAAKFSGREIKTIKGHGASDARHYSEQGIAGVEFGPTGYGLHSDEEWVDVKSLETYYQILKEYLVNL